MQGVLAGTGPLAVAVPAQVDRVGVEAGRRQRPGGAVPGMPRLTAAVQQHNRPASGVTGDVGRQGQPVRTGKFDALDRVIRTARHERSLRRENPVSMLTLMSAASDSGPAQSDPTHSEPAFPAFVGGEGQLPPWGEEPFLLCGGCRMFRESCRLGMTSETLQEDKSVRYELLCPTEQQAGPEIAHGGWTAAVFDEMVGHLPLLNGHMTVTGKLSVRYRRPVPVERALVGVARIDRIEGSRWYLTATIALASTGAELATCEAVMVERDMEHFARHEKWLADQDQAEPTPSENDVPGPESKSHQ
jgi:acyl-coenzyme A thioesterase PaaI-like protein